MGFWNILQDMLAGNERKDAIRNNQRKRAPTATGRHTSLFSKGTVVPYPFDCITVPLPYFRIVYLCTGTREPFR